MWCKRQMENRDGAVEKNNPYQIIELEKKLSFLIEWTFMHKCAYFVTIQIPFYFIFSFFLFPLYRRSLLWLIFWIPRNNKLTILHISNQSLTHIESFQWQTKKQKKAIAFFLSLTFFYCTFVRVWLYVFVMLLMWP